MYKAIIQTSLKKSILDPQGQTTLHALHTMGFENAKDLRIGKHFELVLDVASEAEAEKAVKSICDQLLCNLVIEDYTYEIAQEEVAAS